MASSRELWLLWPALLHGSDVAGADHVQAFQSAMALPLHHCLPQHVPTACVS